MFWRPDTLKTRSTDRGSLSFISRRPGHLRSSRSGELAVATSWRARPTCTRAQSLQSQKSGSCSQKEIQASCHEHQIWAPGGKKRGQDFVAAHLIEQADKSPVEQADGYSDGYSVKGSALAHGE